jgi:hypothetical protein
LMRRRYSRRVRGLGWFMGGSLADPSAHAHRN